MADNRNPISIQLIEKGIYKISIKLDNWEMSRQVTESALKDLVEEINKNFYELMGISPVYIEILIFYNHLIYLHLGCNWS